MDTQFDVIVIGSGAGGAAVAYQLVQSGARVLVLERGDNLPRDGSTLDVETVLHQGRFKHTETWLAANGKKISPSEFANVGGKTKWYGAALLRFSPAEFIPDAVHGASGFPLSYYELEPFYAEAERLLGVTTFATEPDLAALRAGFEADGWQAEPLPLGLSPQILDFPQEAKHFDGFASCLDLKSDAQSNLLARLAGMPNLTLRTKSEVVALLPSNFDKLRISSVQTQDGQVYSAKYIVLAAGALHSPRILSRYLKLQALSGVLPASDHVGRHYKCHHNTALVAVSTKVKTDVLRKTTLFLNNKFPHSSMQTLGWIDGEIIGLEAPRWSPRWLNNSIGRRAYGFWLTTEDGSHPDNRVTAQVNGVDHPVLDYDPARTPMGLFEHRQLVRDVRQTLFGMGHISLTKTMPLEATAHACGTLAAGVDARNSVVDVRGRVHGMANLYVADGSVLARSSRVNPALTIYAWALRLGSHLSQEEARHAA